MMVEDETYFKMERDRKECKEFTKRAHETIDILTEENSQLVVENKNLSQKLHDVSKMALNANRLKEAYDREKQTATFWREKVAKRILEIKTLKERLKEYEDGEEDPDAEIKDLIEYED